ncbi:hypothetical protein KW846_03890 [Pseudomonas sp. PDM32]|uniref:hypothetical protein n=1 Tax=Pseudomonas sp. PDM32 TaxID=2854768 RepID=UPI001C469EEA|nr:hypothetical protein [Pseudomonas sp. PDM32]MBV7571834.1 hypothetical protein [Pseudomonas sp. PDM32]
MNRWLASIGLFFSAIYLYGIYYFAGSRLGALQTMELNELGDFLAGVFGPVSILWLILGFFQQGLELRQNNEALNLQAAELKNSVDQQKEMVAVTREQVAAELERIRVERERRAASLEPVFAFKEIYGHENNGMYFFQGRITNAGNKITELTVSVDNERYRVAQSEYPSLLHGGAFDLGMTIPRLEDFSEFVITLGYRNEEGTYGSKTFKMVPLPREVNRGPGFVRMNAA